MLGWELQALSGVRHCRVRIAWSYVLGHSKKMIDHNKGIKQTNERTNKQTQDKPHTRFWAPDLRIALEFVDRTF